MRPTIRLGLLLGLSMGMFAWSAHADVTLTGPDANAGTYSTSGLAGIATGSDTVSSGGLTGISVWGLLGGANSATATSPTYGGITTSTPDGYNGKNAILRYYLLATGSDGSRSIVSLGEIDPAFGGTAASPAFIAFQNTGGGSLAIPSLIVPGAPGRDISNLTSLQLLAAPALTGPGGLSTSVTLSGPVMEPGSYTLNDLQTKFTPATSTVGTDIYTGVPLWTFLNPSTSDITSQIVITAGTDGYEVVLSLAELDPNLGGNPNDFLPYASNLPGEFPASGVGRTILPGDNKHGRWESNLLSVQLEDVPEPATIAILAGGLLALGAVRRARRPSHAVA